MHPGPLDLPGLCQEGCEVPDVPGAVQEAHDAERGGGGFGQAPQTVNAASSSSSWGGMSDYMSGLRNNVGYSDPGGNFGRSVLTSGNDYGIWNG